MGRSRRWDYMAGKNYNPPNDDCPECTEPSRTWHQGSKTVDGVKVTRFICDNRHEWSVRDEPE